MFNCNVIGDLLFETKINLDATYLSRVKTERKTCNEFLHCAFTRSSTRVEQSNWGWQGSVVWTPLHVISIASTKPTPSAEPNYRHPVLQRRAR